MAQGSRFKRGGTWHGLARTPALARKEGGLGATCPHMATSLASPQPSSRQLPAPARHRKTRQDSMVGLVLYRPPKALTAVQSLSLINVRERRYRRGSGVPVPRRLPTRQTASAEIPDALAVRHFIRHRGSL